MRIPKKKNGFALIAALLANLILLAVGIIAINLSTQDIRISMKMVGEKKAMAAAESGIHALTQNFDPGNLTTSALTNVQVDASNDPNSRYTVAAPTLPTTGPTMLPMSGYSIGGGQMWGQERYNTTVTGTNTAYNATVQVDIGLGYGPIEITTMYR
jgi:Tfp pilus assembly protein PilX